MRCLTLDDFQMEIGFQGVKISVVMQKIKGVVNTECPNKDVHGLADGHPFFTKKTIMQGTVQTSSRHHQSQHSFSLSSPLVYRQFYYTHLKQQKKLTFSYPTRLWCWNFLIHFAMMSVIGDSIMNSNYTAVIKQEADWWIGWIEEVPGVNCQESSREKLLMSLRETLGEAIKLNRADALESVGDDFEELLIAV